MIRSDFMSLALSFIGLKSSSYNRANIGSIESGFDCSGFVNYVLIKSEYKYSIPRHANEMFDRFGITIHYESILPGDLIFFSNKGGTYADHVGIYCGNNKYIHSPGRNNCKICIKNLEFKEIKPRINSNYEQIYFINPIGFKRITIPDEKGRYNINFLTS